MAQKCAAWRRNTGRRSCEQRGPFVQRRMGVEVGEHTLDKRAFDLQAGLDIGDRLKCCCPRPERHILLGCTEQLCGGLGLRTRFEPA